jgi:TusA-related sulfurtransferase
MSKQIVDARGQECPRPLMLTKKALKDEGITGEFVVLIDRENPRANIEKLLQDNGITFHTDKKEDHYRITVNKSGT